MQRNENSSSQARRFIDDPQEYRDGILVRRGGRVKPKAVGGRDLAVVFFLRSIAKFLILFELARVDRRDSP